MTERFDLSTHLRAPRARCDGDAAAGLRVVADLPRGLRAALRERRDRGSARGRLRAGRDLGHLGAAPGRRGGRRPAHGSRRRHPGARRRGGDDAAATRRGDDQPDGGVASQRRARAGHGAVHHAGVGHRAPTDRRRAPPAERIRARSRVGQSSLHAHPERSRRASSRASRPRAIAEVRSSSAASRTSRSAWRCSGTSSRSR